VFKGTFNSLADYFFIFPVHRLQGVVKDPFAAHLADQGERNIA
jgi:hypothetical protein